MNTVTRPTLQDLFDELNRTHFAGKLPRVVVSRVPAREVPFFESAAARAARPTGACNFLLRQIHIDEALDPVAARETLLREMCHMARPAGLFYASGETHGPWWRVEMLRLAAQHGEAWAVQDVARFPNSSRHRELFTGVTPG